MTPRAKLTLSFCAILLLFGVNFGVYFWTVNRRNTAVQNLDAALSRVAVLSAVHQDLDNLTKEVALLSQLKFEEGSSAPDPGDQKSFFQRIDSLQSKTDQLKKLCDTVRTPEIEPFTGAVDDLAQSWKTFYRNLGVQQAKAVTELAVRTEPLTERVTAVLLPSLQKAINQQAIAAKNALSEITQWADQFTFFVFIISLILASLLAVLGIQASA